MLNTKELRRPTWLAAIAMTAGLAGCSKAVVLNPAGDIAAQQGQMVITATLLMLIIIVPVIALTLFFAWKYRQGNTEAEYDPEWHHSTTLELVIWTVPLVIIIALGALTWIGTHKLDPYRPLDRVDAHLDGNGTLPADAVISTIPRAGKPLAADNLAMPR